MSPRADEGDEAWDPDESEMDQDGSAEYEQNVPCPYCGQMIYEQAERCPECGKYISEEDNPPKQQPWVWVTVLVCVLLIIVFWIMS